MNIFIICSIIILVSFSLTYLVKRWAVNRSILDLPNERSSHSIPTPRIGGVAICVTWFVLVVFLFLRKGIDSNLFFALLCGLPISLIGLIDDVITITPKVRLFIQVTSATMVLVFLGGLNSIDIGCCILNVPFIFSVFAVIGIVWFTNLFNFLDGIDGYISAEVIFICLSAFFLLRIEISLFLATTIVGFLIWNWQPAKIFMGDVGSTLLGFTIGIFSVYYQKSGDSSIILWLILTSLFWFDASLTLYRRWRNGEVLSKAHKKHAYQRIVQSGYSHQKTVLYSMLINLPILCFALVAHKYPTFLLIILIINIAYLSLIMRFVDKRFSFDKI